MLCRYRKKGKVKQYVYGHKTYLFPSDRWTPVNDIRLFKKLQSYPDVFDTLLFFDLKPFLAISNKITFKKDLVFTSSRVVADKLDNMPYVRLQAHKPEIGEWIFKILGYSDADLTAYQDTKKIVNILAHRDLGGIGDIIMTTSVIEDVIKKYGHYKITYACPDAFLPLLENNPFITDLKPIKSNVTKNDWDAIVNLTSDCIKYEMKYQPNVKLNRAEIFAEKCGLSIENVPRPKVYLTGAEILGAKEELKHFKLKIGLVLKSNALVRNWPYFKELRKLLSEKYPDATFLEFCVKMPPYWKFIKKSYPVFERSLREVKALINECDVVISPDTGLAHIASALRVPTVWIFTHIDGKVRTKNYDNVWVCQKAVKNCASKGVPCWYAILCDKDKVERKKDPLCSLAIKPKYVMDKVNDVLSRPNISYCVVYKDNERTTTECIKRVLKYRRYNDELVLVDNGSRNKEFLNPLLKGQPSIVKIRNEKNEGCIKARNQAMRRAKGEYLLILDNDQYISPVSVHKLMNTEGDVIGVEGWSMDKGAWAFDIKESKGELAYVGGGGLLVKKSVADDIDYLDEIYAPAWFSDPDFCFKAKEKGYKIIFCKDADIKHLKHKTIFSQTDFDHQKAWKRSHKLFKGKWNGMFGIGENVVKRKKTTKAKILMMCDVKDWAWWYKSEYVRMYLAEKFDIDIWAPPESFPKKKYDLYFTFVPTQLPYIKNVPKERKITGVTAHPGFDRCFKGKKNIDWNNEVMALHANSLLLYDLIKNYHKQVFYVPNGVDTELFSYQNFVERNNLVIGFVGRQNEGDDKGLNTIIRPAVESLEGVELKTNTKLYNNSVSLSDMVKFYCDIDIYVVASTMDGTPNPMLEASSCGRPVIANRIGNASEFIIDEKSGFLVERKIEEYAKKIKYLQEKRDVLIGMGKEARKRALLWRWSNQVKMYENIFSQILVG